MLPSLTITYGCKDVAHDVTSYALFKCVERSDDGKMTLRIPSGDAARAQLFGDPCVGILKHICVTTDDAPLVTVSHTETFVLDISDKKIDLPTCDGFHRSESGKHVVFVQGCAGLGNSLYQVAAGVHYVESFPDLFELRLIDTPQLRWGTSHAPDRDKRLRDETGVPVPYLDSVFRHVSKTSHLPPGDSFGTLHNDYHCATATEHVLRTAPQNRLICGWNQFSNFVSLHLDCLFTKYLCLDDAKITDYLVRKYANNDVSRFQSKVLLTLRRGHDFAHMTRLSNTVYSDVLATHFADKDILLIGDTTLVPSLAADQVSRVTVVDESDVVQFSLARLCPHIVVSESTFHVWMGYLCSFTFRDRASVLYFEPTDVSARHLFLPGWKGVAL